MLFVEGWISDAATHGTFLSTKPKNLSVHNIFV